MGVREIILISRPRFWLYTAGPYLLGYTASSEAICDLLSPAFIGIFLYFMIPANFYLYGINDLFDLDTDVYNPKKGSREVLSTEIGVTKLAAVVIASLVISIPVLAILRGYPMLLMMLFLLLSTIYSAPPLRLKSRAFLDSYSNSLYAVPMIMGYSQNRGYLPETSIIIASILWTAAMHAFSAIPDIEYDRKAGLRTTAVLLGARGSLAFCTINWGLASLIAITYDPLLLPSLLYPAISLYLLFKPESVERIYWQFPKINTVMGFLAFIYILYRKGFLISIAIPQCS
jgi:4-hydroxybenzoate polyprenyltransferase